MVTRNFPPLTGGMERLLLQAFKALEHEYAVGLVGPTGCGAYADPVMGSCPPHPLARFLACCVQAMHRAVRRFQPDLLFCGSGLTVLPAALAAPRLPRIAYLHGLDLVADAWLYRTLFLPPIRRCSQLIANSGYTAACARERGVPTDRIRVIHPGVAPVAVLPDRNTARTALALAPHVPVLLSVGRLTPRKGIYEFLQRAFPVIRARFPTVVLLVVGDDPVAAIAPRGRSRDLANLIRQERLETQVRLLGRIDDATLALAYAAADMHVFPVRAMPGDAEGFGMVALEAAAHGLPTVAFDAGGVADAVADGRSGWLLAAEDYAALSARIIAYLGGASSGVTPGTCRAFADGHSWEVFGSELRAACGAPSGNASWSRSASL